MVKFQKRERRRLVRRQHVVRIAAAWVFTLPATGVLAAICYALIRSLAA